MGNPLLVELIHKAQYIIGESAGVKVLGTYYISKNDQGDKILLPSLDIIKKTVFE